MTASHPDQSGLDPDPALLLAWFAEHRRDLPWRRPDRSPWGVLVSEIMLQQTPVDRVIPAWTAWLRRWPRPADLATEAPGEAVRAWGRLGYPRRALRLHEAAGAMLERHAGVPEALADLRALPGVGDYTASAVRAFAFGRRTVVLDTNVRRVLARHRAGREVPPPSITNAERRVADRVVPPSDALGAAWSAAIMELGALVCTATAPRCPRCPLRTGCAWLAAGQPPHDGPRPRPQGYAGTDRQVRGRLLAVLRDAPGPVAEAALRRVWDLDEQRQRALASLLADGLVERCPDGRYQLPGGSADRDTPPAQPAGSCGSG